MKKLLLVSTLCATAFSAQSQIFTNDKDFIIEVAGAVTAHIIDDTPDGSPLTLKVTDAYFNFKPTYTLDNDMVVYSDLKLQSFTNGSTDLSEGYVGIDYNDFSLTAGKHSYASGAFGISRSKTFGPSSSLGETSGQEVLKVAYTKEKFNAAVSYDFADHDTDRSSFDMYFTGLLGDFDAAGTFQVQKANAATDTVFYFGYSAYYTLEKFYVGGSFSMDTTTDNNLSVIEFASALSITDKITVGGGVGQIIPEEGDVELLIYANSEYALHKEITAYTEAGISTQESAELGLAVGLTVIF
ncbi:hypothetical protein [Marinicellulosiphila megalodicopiae]|uniref:hypothetical protein n=1 Tax=Marinicellulosiphila megalodicopiae TaxID=2724896 RepID=UPI003BB0454D